MARQTAEGGKWKRTVRTRGVVMGVTPQQDGIGCYATGHQSYLYTSPLVPLFFPPQAPLLLIRTTRLEAQLWDMYAAGFHHNIDFFFLGGWNFVPMLITLNSQIQSAFKGCVSPHISFLWGWKSLLLGPSQPSWDTPRDCWKQKLIEIWSAYSPSKTEIVLWWYRCWDIINLSIIRDFSIPFTPQISFLYIWLY